MSEDTPDITLQQQQALTKEQLLAEARLFLNTTRTMTLATVDDQGRPHACNLQYAADENMRLVFVSNDASQHSQHVQVRPDVAATIYAHDDRPEHIHGLQLHGQISTLTDPTDANAAFELYTQRYPFVAVTPRFRQIIESMQFYRFTPTWLRWIDNRRGFGWKQELTLT